VSALKTACRGDGAESAARACHRDSLTYSWPKGGHVPPGDFKWLGHCRHGNMHPDGLDEQHLCERAIDHSGMLGWYAPDADPLHALAPTPPPASAAPDPQPFLSTVRSE
jgi:hypothetical protein